MNIISPIIIKSPKKDNTLTSFAPQGIWRKFSATLCCLTLLSINTMITCVLRLSMNWAMYGIIAQATNYPLFNGGLTFMGCGVNEAHSNGHCWDSSKAIEPARMLQ